MNVSCRCACVVCVVKSDFEFKAGGIKIHENKHLIQGARVQRCCVCCTSINFIISVQLGIHLSKESLLLLLFLVACGHATHAQGHHTMPCLCRFADWSCLHNMVCVLLLYIIETVIVVVSAFARKELLSFCGCV